MSATEDVPVTARLPREDVEKLERLVVLSERSRSAEIRRAVREYLEREASDATG